MDVSGGDVVISEDSDAHIIFSSNGFLYVEKYPSDSGTIIQCIRRGVCPAQGIIVDQEITLTTQHNHSYYADRVVALKTRNDINRKNSKLELIKLVKCKPSSSQFPTPNKKQVENKNGSQNNNSNNIVTKTFFVSGGNSGKPTPVKIVCTPSQRVPSTQNKPNSDVETEEPDISPSPTSYSQYANMGEDLEEAVLSDDEENVCEVSEDSDGEHLPLMTIKTEEYDSPTTPSQDVGNDEDGAPDSNMIEVEACQTLVEGTDVDQTEEDIKDIFGTDEPMESPSGSKQPVQRRGEADEEEESGGGGGGSQVELIEGTMRNSFLYLQDGFLYERNTVLRNKRMYMHCNQRRKHPFCQARGVMEGGRIRITREHNHLPDPIKVDQLKLKARCKRRVEEEANANFKTIFEEEAANFKDSSFEFKYSFFGGVMKRRKRSVLEPPIGMDDFMQTLQENEQRFCTTLSGQQFFSSFITATDFSIATFISPAFSELLKNVETVHVDCMFKDVPTLFTRLCTILISYEDYVFPLAYAFMTSDTEAAYSILFKYFKQQLPELTPTLFVMEYDQKVINAVTAAYPTTQCIGGLFNYTLAIWREIHDKNFIKYYTEEREAQITVRMLLALPLLPPKDTQAGFAYLRRRVQNLQKGRVILQSILDCVQHCWLNRLGTENFSVSGKPYRCTFDVESYLGKMKYKVGCSSGNIWNTLDKLKQFEDLEKKELEKVMKRAGSKRKTSCVISHGKVKELSDKLINKKIVAKAFLEEVLTFLNPPTSDALQMYMDMYPTRIVPQFKPLLQIVTFEQLQEM